jgi:hypothetical protein
MNAYVMTRHADFVRWWTLPPTTTRARGDRGEGVISAAIAVLIMAFLGALMWVAFQTMWSNTQAKTEQQIEKIGQ